MLKKITNTWTVLLLLCLMAYMAMASTITVKAETIEGNGVVNLGSQLDFGSRSNAVMFLQSLLAADASIGFSSNNITGYYGPATRAAVRKLQAKYGLPPVGRVGPATLQVLNNISAESPFAIVNVNGTSCAMIPPGHLFAPGYIKNRGTEVAPSCQVLPPGILKRISGNPPAPGGDTTAPVVSDVRVQNIGSGMALVTWTTNEDASGQLMYGTTAAYGLTASMSGQRMRFHIAFLTGLSANTTYNYQIRSVDAAGNVSVSGNFMFNTGASGDVSAPTISNVVVSNVTSGSATINWNSNEGGMTQIRYGTTTSYGSAVNVAGSIGSNQSVLGGLSSNTLYHYKIVSVDAAGNQSVSGDFTFTTGPSGSDTSAPVVSGVSISALGSSQATINWTTNEPASSTIRYGTTTSYGLEVTSSLVTSHHQTLVGLSANTMYHYQIVSRDASGNVSVSGDFTFTTSTSADVTGPTISNIVVAATGENRVLITWQTNEPATSKVYYGTTPPLLTSSGNMSLETSHSIALTNLIDGRYYYVIESVDASGNVTQTSQFSFMSE